MQRKDLHLGKSLEDLKKYYEIEPHVLKNPFPKLLVSLNKIMGEAERLRLDGDEERSFVLYMKFMTIIGHMQKTPSFQKEKSQISKVLGSNETFKKHMDRLEELQRSLKTRYAAKIAQEPFADLPALVEADSMQLDLSSTSRSEIKNTIESRELFTKIKAEDKILIMDCRSEQDYEASKMIYKYTINVPENLLNLGMTASKIQERLPNESKVYWSLRGTRCIVFVDWSSKRFNRNSSVWHLKEILMEWDQDVDTKPEMYLLEGGYESWIMHYPMMCTNPQVTPPKTTNGNGPTIEDVEYPNWEDIQMKDSSINRSSLTPQIDRSMKVNAVRAYENGKSQLELLEESELLMNKSLNTEKELLSLETNLKRMASDKENEEDSSIKEQATLFKIWELQSKAKDISVEENSIKEQLSQKMGKDPLEMTKVMQVELHLQELSTERAKLQDERERKKKEREEALKIARSRKPTFDGHKTPPKSQRKDELILSPKALSNQITNTAAVPIFDRSSKPSQPYIYQPFNEQDFAPVYGRVERGLTGLKNLGNSCYMNSIIQCLSNTSTLTEFLLDSKYEKNVNSANKTKGRIVRTLAAVIRMLWNGECKYISSKNLKAVIGEQDHLFYGMDQQDSHEFLIMLIDWLQSDLQTLPVQITMDLLPASEKAWLEYTKAKESFILRLFYGQIKSTVKCTKCSKESATYDTFSNLSLELPPNNIDKCHINDCFNMYFHGEKVYGWNCPHCKEPREAIKKLDISKLPPVLVIHLKRFYADPYSNSTFRKKTIYVDFPLSDMSMMPYVARSEKNSGSNLKHVYSLYAVSNHYGTMESGHYTAFCKNAIHERWYKFDDDTVSSLDRSDVRSSAAYILFYTTSNDVRSQRY